MFLAMWVTRNALSTLIQSTNSGRDSFTCTNMICQVQLLVYTRLAIRALIMHVLYNKRRYNNIRGTMSYIFLWAKQLWKNITHCISRSYWILIRHWKWSHDSMLSSSEFEQIQNIVQYQQSSMFNPKMEMQLDLFKINGCHGKPWTSIIVDFGMSGSQRIVRKSQAW